MMATTRRALLASAPILAAALAPRKTWAYDPLRAGGVWYPFHAEEAHDLSQAVGPVLPVADLPDLAEVLIPVDPPAVPPEAVFLDAEGVEHRLSEFRGHGMVVNFWATRCRPCVAEMPSLATLARALAPHGIAVLTVSSDRGGAGTVSAWFQERGISGLPVLLDPKGAMARAWGTRGIPATHVIARDGKRRGYIEGAADWSSVATQALVRRLVEV